MPENTPSKFETIVNEALSRYKGTNLLVGDRVKFVDNFLKHEWMKRQPELKVERIKAMIESGNNIRVSAVKANKPATAQTGHFEDVDNFYVDIVSEPAPGLFHQVFTVPQELVENIEDYPNLAGKTPDHQIKSDPSQIKPGNLERGNSDTFKQTSSNSPERNLPMSNTVIPSPAPPKHYTGKYLEG